MYNFIVDFSLRRSAAAAQGMVLRDFPEVVESIFQLFADEGEIYDTVNFILLSLLLPRITVKNTVYLYSGKN